MKPALVALIAAVSCAASFAVRDLHSRERTTTIPCPHCKNGGACVRSNDASGVFGETIKSIIGSLSLSTQVAPPVCSCPVPWTGDRCTVRGAYERPAQQEDNEDAIEEKPGARPVARTFLPKFGSFISPTSAPQVVLLTLVLDDAEDSVLQDTDNLAMSVYSALCPSAPCTLGLALEDIRVLDFAGSAVRVAISSPGHRKVLKTVRAILESLLTSDSGALRTDVFGGVLPQQCSVELSSFPAAAERDAWRMAAKQGTARRAGTEQPVAMHGLSSSSASTAVSNSHQDKEEPESPEEDLDRQWIAERKDRQGDLIGHQQSSTAIVCICILTLAYLSITVFDVLIERISIWLFPPEFGFCAIQEANQMDSAFASAQAKELRQHFQTLRVTAAYAKPFIAQSTVAASLMYMAHTRARELTKGFGDPPPAVRIGMIGLTFNIIALTALASAHAWFHYRNTLLNRSDKTPVHIVVMTLMGVASFLNILFYATMMVSVLGLDATSCMADEVAAANMWKDEEPPDLSAEHRLCWQVCVQYVLVNLFALLVVARELLKSAKEQGVEEQDHLPEEEQMHGVDNDAHVSSDFVNIFRMLHRCVNLAGYVSVLCLVLREVVVDEDSNAAALRLWLLQLVSWVMVGYTIFTAAFMFCPRQYGLKFEFPEYVVPFGSSLDYLLATSKVPWVAKLFMFVRRCVLLTLFISIFILSFSVFFGENTSEGVYAMPEVPWPVVWALLVMTLSMCFKTALLFHEVFVGPQHQSEAGAHNRTDSHEMLTLESAVREVECFIGICPMLSCLFIVTLGRAQELNPMAKVQPFQLTAMNLVTQTILLQMILAVVEAGLRRLLFVDYRGVKAEQKAAGLGAEVLGKEVSDLVRDKGETTVDYPDRSTPVPSLTALQTSDLPGMGSYSLSEKATKHKDPLEAREFPLKYEFHYLGARSAKLLGTAAQAIFLGTQCVSVLVLIVGTVMVDSPYQLRMEDSYTQEDWLSDWMPLVPRNAPMSSALMCTLWFVGVFYMSNATSEVCITLVQFGAKGTKWFYKAFSRARELSETIPNVCVLYLTARIQASLLHGVNSAPPMWMQVQMYIIYWSFSAELITSVLAPGLTAEFIKIDQNARLVPKVRYFFFVVEAISTIGMYEGILALVIGMMCMKPEYIVLPDGHTNIPWRGPGAEPTLPAVSVNMWALTLLVFVPGLFHKITQAIIEITKLQMGSTPQLRRKLWAQIQQAGSWMKRNAVLHHALILVRETVMSAIILGILFVPMVELRSLSFKDEAAGTSKEPLLVSLLNAGFFVASLLLVFKTLLVFGFGILEMPLEIEVFPGAVESVEDGTKEEEEEGQHIYSNFSNSWQSEVDLKTNRAAILSRMFKRLAILVTFCEFAASVFLFLGMYHLSKDWGHDVLGKEVFYFGPALMFCSYVGVYYLTFSMLLIGKHGIFLDQLFDTVIMCPLLIILSVGSRMRSLEVAGLKGVVPPWIREITNMCSYCIVLEMALVLILLPLPMRRFWKTGSCRHRNAMDDYMLDFIMNTPRMLAMTSKSIIRVTLYGCIGCIVVSLFWMTEDQCLPQSGGV